MKNVPGKEFELKALELHKEFSPNSRIHYNYKVRGINSDTIRQIDFAIFDKVGFYELFVAVECKDYKNPVNIKSVEAFVSVIEDIRAHKGVMISRKGFTQSAKNLALKKKISLLTLIDHEPFSTGIYLPISIEYKRITDYALSIRTRKDLTLRGFIDKRNILIYDRSKKFVNALGKLIEDKFSTFDHTLKIGKHEYSISDVYINIENVFYCVDFLVEFTVKSYVANHELQLMALAGFIDVIEDNIRVKEMESEPLKLLSSEELNTKPFNFNKIESKNFLISAFIKSKC